MKFNLLLFVLILTSCSVNELEEKIPLTFVEDALIKDSVSISLPSFEYGFPFVAHDSITYINIYVLNDSVIQVNDSLFELEETKERLYFLAKDIVDDSNTSNYSGGAKPILEYINRINLDSNFTINLFIDTNIHYGLLDNLYTNLFKLNNTNRLINIIDRDNNHIQVTQSHYSEMGPPCIRLTMYFEILINYNNQLLIEGEWDKTFEDIPERIVEWYTNPTNRDDLPRMNEVTLKQCKQNLSIIKNEESDNIKTLKKWERKLETVMLLGNYKSINRSSRIFVQADVKTSITSYLSVLDKINQGLLKLRNEFCLQKFNLEYNNLRFNKI
jgi:biopolymer transport protein ExbD